MHYASSLYDVTTNLRSPSGSLARRIGAEIRAEMARQDISQEELARRLGWSQQWVSRRITGVTPVDAGELEAIAAALGVPVSQLLTTPTTIPRSTP